MGQINPDDADEDGDGHWRITLPTDVLMSGQMTDALRAQIVAAVASRNYTGTNQTSIDNMRRDRVYIAVFLTMASPDYLTQK